MWRALKLIVSDRSIASAVTALFLLGFTFAAVAPYYSIIAVHQLGLSKSQYAAVFAVGAILSTIASLVMGYVSDTTASRKPGILLALFGGFLGFGCFALFPSLWTFFAWQLLVMPLTGTAFSQLFASVRSLSADKSDSAAINSVTRSVYALSWILTPAAVGALVATRENVSDAVFVAAVAFLVSGTLYAVYGPSTSNTQPNPNTGWSGFKTAFSEVKNPKLLLRIASLAGIATIHPANAALLPLQVLQVGGSTTDVGIIAGLAAGLEIPLMLLGGYLAQRVALWRLIVGAGFVHAVYLVLLGSSFTLPQIYGLTILHAAGASIMLTLHMTYLQDQLPDRPGLGTSLLSIASVLQKLLGALVFASSGLAWGFFGASIVGGLIACAGMIGLYMLDRSKSEIKPGLGGA
jgi:predicted MFS family arabinose efflux permease